MQPSLGDRLGFAALIVALLSVSAFYLLPNDKWVGWFALVVAVLLLFAWAYLERQQHSVPWRRIVAITILVGLVVLVTIRTARTPRKKAESGEQLSEQASVRPISELAEIKKSLEELNRRLAEKGNARDKIQNGRVQDKATAAVDKAPFAVAVEVKLMVPGPSKDIAGTSFWGLSLAGRSCFLRSADLVMLIRIKNLQSIKTMITAYNVYGLGGELHRISMLTNSPVQILPHGTIPRDATGTVRVQIPTGSGNLNAGFVNFKFVDADFSTAVGVQGDILDKAIADRYLEPGDTVRGWAFFEYPTLGSIPANLTLKISDDFGHTYSFNIPDEAGNPSGDTLRREIVLTGPTMNLSSCIRLLHPTPAQ